MVWWLLYAVHRAVFEVRRNCFIRGVSGVVGCLHMSVGLKIETDDKSPWGLCVRHSL
jgi:hypothetical protein